MTAHQRRRRHVRPPARARRVPASRCWRQTLPGRRGSSSSTTPRASAATPARRRARVRAEAPVRYVPGRRPRARRRAQPRAARGRHARSSRSPTTTSSPTARWLEAIVAAFDERAERRLRDRPDRRRSSSRPRRRRLLDAYAGFDKGTTRRVFDLDAHRPPDPLFPFTAGTLGSGANMAFTARRPRRDRRLRPRARRRHARARRRRPLRVLRGAPARPPARLRARRRRAPPPRRATSDALRRQVYGYGVGLDRVPDEVRCSTGRGCWPAALAAAPRAIGHVLGAGRRRTRGSPPTIPPRARCARERLGMLAGPFAYLARSRYDAGRAACADPGPALPQRRRARSTRASRSGR